MDTDTVVYGLWGRLYQETRCRSCFHRNVCSRPSFFKSSFVSSNSEIVHKLRGGGLKKKGTFQ